MFLLQCTMILSPLNDGICPSAAISQGNNCFWVKYFDITFTFDLYLGTNWIVATKARGSIELLTGMWKDVFWIFGTSWMLCELAVLVNENIWKIFAPWRGRLCKKFFWRLLKGRAWVASVQNFNLHSPPFMFFVHKYHIFDKYVTKIFPPGSLGSLASSETCEHVLPTRASTCFLHVRARYLFVRARLLFKNVRPGQLKKTMMVNVVLV